MAALAIICALVGGWEAYAQWGGVDDFILPAPSEIAAALFDDRSLLLRDTLVTAQEIVFGLVIALILGALLALVMHLSKALRGAAWPLLVASQAIPVAVIAPLLVTWWGFGIAPKLFVVAIVCYFPVVVTTLGALRSIDPDLHKLLRTLGATRWQRMRYAEIPAALPAALAGAKIAVAIGSIAAVFAEYTGSSEGLGHQLLRSLPQLETARAWAAVVILAALSLICFYALQFAERHLAPWAHRRKDHV
ncbi:MAG TPA: ABC transporter permease [Baekduia sp.]|nr:ABC transporter permease [Baekduia sp.]